MCYVKFKFSAIHAICTMSLQSCDNMACISMCPQVTDMVLSQTVTLPAFVEDLLIEEISDYVFVESRKLGFRLRWDTYDDIYLEV